jgi:hypothetical protein
MNGLQFRTVLTSVRPARVAALINQLDQDWQSCSLRTIEYFSTIWGGAHNIIVPTDGQEIPGAFWDILEAYDADYFSFYYKTGLDEKNDHPERYEKCLNDTVQNYIQENGAEDVEEARQQIDRLLSERPFIDAVPDQLQQQIKRRLAPFHVGEHVIEGGLGLNARAGYPLAALAKFLHNTDHSNQLAMHKPAYAGLFRLWLASITGLAGSAYNDIVSLNRIVPFDYEESSQDQIEYVVRNGQVARDQREWVTPFELANINLGLYRSKYASSLVGPIIVVVGNTIFDYCLYYCLSRMIRFVTWMPLEWLRLDENIYKQYIYSLEYLKLDMQTFPKMIFVSHSLGQADLEGEASKIIKLCSHISEDEVEIRQSIKSLLKHPLRLYELDNADRASSVMTRDGTFIDMFNTPKPKHFKKVEPYEHRWITEVNVLGHQLPRHPELGHWVTRHSIITSDTARVSKYGIAYLCPSSAYFGGDIDTSLIKPTIYVPTADKVFDYIFMKEGYRAALSDKGIYAQRTLNKFGTLEVLGTVLRDEHYRSLLLKYLEKNRPEKGVHDEGCYLSDRRRYLNFPTANKLIGDERKSQRIIETLVQLGVLYRGYVFKCRICKDAAWFGLGETSQLFTCKRCATQQYISTDSYWYESFQPGLFYKLDEIIYQYLTHNGYVATLCLDYLRRKQEASFLFTFDVELVSSESGIGEEKQELDVLCIQDGNIFLGEAKIENRLGKNGASEVTEIRKYYNLVRKIGARGVIFATFSDAWAPQTLANIENTVTDKSIEVILLNREELLLVD